MPEQTYTTSDFMTAVFLRTKNYPMSMKVSNNKATFIFDNTDGKIETLVKAFWDRGEESIVIARDFISNINELKTRIYT